MIFPRQALTAQLILLVFNSIKAPVMSKPKQQRNTPQRRIVLEELRKVASHPTAVELYEIVRHRLPKISLGTVYRNLELLSRMGTIQKLDFVGTEARFDGNPDRHCHVRCVRCGRVDDLHGLSEDLIAETPEEAGGYKILGRRLAFIGVCPDCRESRLPTDLYPKRSNPRQATLPDPQL